MKDLIKLGYYIGQKVLYNDRLYTLDGIVGPDKVLIKREGIQNLVGCNDVRLMLTPLEKMPIKVARELLGQKEPFYSLSLVTELNQQYQSFGILYKPTRDSIDTTFRLVTLTPDVIIILGRAGIDFGTMIIHGLAYKNE